MSKKILAVALAASVALTSQAFAEGNYLGIGFSPYSLEAEADGAAVEGDANVIEAYYGYEWHENFAGEMRLGFGIGSGDLDVKSDLYSGNFGEVKISSMFALYLKPQFKADGFKGYALLGYAGYNTETTFEFGSYSETTDSSDDGFSYGIGAGWDFGQHGIALEWKSTKIDGGDISGIAAFYNYNF